MDNVTILLSESSCGMDVLEVLASGMTGFREGGVLGQGLLHVLELCGCHVSISHLATLPITIIDTFDVSPDGDDTMWPRHF
jgi:hypothetical protein